MKTQRGISKEAVSAATAGARASIQQSSAALLKADRAALEEEFSPAFTVAGGDWRFEGRDDMIKRVSSGAVKFSDISTKIKKVDVPAENVAVVTGRRTVKAVVNGEDFAQSFPFKAVHVLEGGAWRVALWAVDC